MRTRECHSSRFVSTTVALHAQLNVPCDACGFAMTNSFAALISTPDAGAPLANTDQGVQREGNQMQRAGRRPGPVQATSNLQAQRKGRKQPLASGRAADGGTRVTSGARRKQVRPPRDFNNAGNTVGEKEKKRIPDGGPLKRRHRSLPVWLEPAATVVISEPSAVGPAVDELLESTRIAVDCEGVSLSRTGMLTLVQVASNTSVYIFDIVAGGRPLFDAGLRRVLESPKCIKIMHDCRHDCDALEHQFDVRLAPVADTQISFSVLREVRELPIGLPVSLRTLLKKFCGVSEDNIAIKDSVKAQMRENETFWLDRPISQAGLAYARFDVMYLIHLSKILAIHITDADGGGWERILKESCKYSALFRDDADGPRKENARWARMVTEAKCGQAIRDRRKTLQDLQAVDAMMKFSFKREAILCALEPIGSKEVVDS